MHPHQSIVPEDYMNFYAEQAIELGYMSSYLPPYKTEIDQTFMVSLAKVIFSNPMKTQITVKNNFKSDTEAQAFVINMKGENSDGFIFSILRIYIPLEEINKVKILNLKITSDSSSKGPLMSCRLFVTRRPPAEF